MGNEASPAAESRCVTIVGPSSLQNKLLAKLIGERTGYSCDIRPAEACDGHAAGASVLALLDAAQCETIMPAVCASGVYSTIALINADRASPAWDRFVTYPGVKGLFSPEVSEEQLIKGIRAIFDGEYWFSRKLLCAHLERTRAAAVPPAPVPGGGVLTRKEIETLRLLATGDSTEHIAHTLKVSPHTVKTHIYNLFRKINVSNRLQAVHWAARNMIIAEQRPSR